MPPNLLDRDHETPMPVDDQTGIGIGKNGKGNSDGSIRGKVVAKGGRDMI
jgi:hypothetical protein